LSEIGQLRAEVFHLLDLRAWLSLPHAGRTKEQGRATDTDRRGPTGLRVNRDPCSLDMENHEDPPEVHRGQLSSIPNLEEALPADQNQSEKANRLSDFGRRCGISPNSSRPYLGRMANCLRNAKNASIEQ
jgi:hypothetical protein